MADRENRFEDRRADDDDDDDDDDDAVFDLKWLGIRSQKEKVLKSRKDF